MTGSQLLDRNAKEFGIFENDDCPASAALARC